MKKILAVLLSLLIAFAVVGAGAESNFKQASWGDSLEKVIATEGTPVDRSPITGTNGERIFYKTTAVGLDVWMFYNFNDNKLYAAGYLFNEEHSNDQSYIDDYEKYRDALTKKYGKPETDTVVWNDQSMKEYYIKNGKSMGDAVCYGYCSYYTLYNLDDTKITMVMTADNYDINTLVSYDSKTIKPAEADYSSEI